MGMAHVFSGPHSIDDLCPQAWLCYSYLQFHENILLQSFTREGEET